MANLSDIETLAECYAGEKAALAAHVQNLETALEQMKRRWLPDIAESARRTADARALLHQAVKESPALFVRPRTLTVHGIKVGYQMHRGALAVDNEAATIKRIRELLPDLADVLIQVKESVVKAALNKLPAADLKRIGVGIEDDTDEVVIKSDLDKIEKFINALMAEQEGEAKAVLAGEG